MRQEIVITVMANRFICRIPRQIFGAAIPIGDLTIGVNKVNAVKKAVQQLCVERLGMFGRLVSCEDWFIG